MRSPSTAITTTRTPEDETRALRWQTRLQYLMDLCNKYSSVPDALIPEKHRKVFYMMKMFVNKVLVRYSTGVKVECAKNKETVILLGRPTPPGLPSNGIWLGLGQRENTALTIKAQLYLCVRGAEFHVHIKRQVLSMPFSNNKSIAQEDAQMLLDFSNTSA